MSERILITRIRQDGGTQPRADLNMDAVRDYAEALKDGAKFPPVRVFFDGKDYWLSDGFHRVAAHVSIGWVEIDAEVMQGTQRHAQWDSFSANKNQGLRRTGADVKRILDCLYADKLWKTMSQRAIADHVGCVRSTVSKYIKLYREATGDDGPRAGPTPHNAGKAKHEAFLPQETAAAPARADEKDGSNSTDEGSSLPGPGQNTKPATTPPKAPIPEGGQPWDEFNAAVRERVIGLLRQAYKEFAEIAEYEKDGKRFKCQWAQGFSVTGTLGALYAFSSSIEDQLPAEPAPGWPGFVNKARLKVLASLARKSA